MNEEIVTRIDEECRLVSFVECRLVSFIRCRKTIWTRYVMRVEGILKEVLECRMKGKRSRGRPMRGMLDEYSVRLYVHMKNGGRGEISGVVGCHGPDMN